MKSCTPRHPLEVLTRHLASTAQHTRALIAEYCDQRLHVEEDAPGSLRAGRQALVWSPTTLWNHRCRCSEHICTPNKRPHTLLCPFLQWSSAAWGKIGPAHLMNAALGASPQSPMLRLVVLWLSLFPDPEPQTLDKTRKLRRFSQPG